MSQKAQTQKIVKMNTSDKKLLRLFSSQSLSDKDIVFINNAYQQKQGLHFRYSVIFTTLSTLVVGYFFTRFSPNSTKIVFYGGLGLAQHMFWSVLSTQRFQGLVSPYYHKYQIK